MDHLLNRFPSLKCVFYLTCRMHTYVEFFFACIVNIIWASLEIILWETIHSSRREVLNWSLRETSWRQHESNRAINLYSSLARTQTKPKCDLNPASIPTIPAVDSTIPKKTRSTNTSMSKLRENACSVPFRRWKVLLSTFETGARGPTVFFPPRTHHRMRTNLAQEVW